MNNLETQPDPEPNTVQFQAIENLSEAEIKEIDRVLLKHTGRSWRKVARIVGSAMIETKDNSQGIPDLYFAQRIRKMVTEGKLESQGFLANMRYSEVRRVDSREGT